MVKVLGHRNNRTAYVFETVLSERFNMSVDIISDPKEFDSWEGLKINYTSDVRESGLHILPSGFLSETEIKNEYPQVVWEDEKPILFVLKSKYNYDPFAAIFFMLSRYEEYIHPERDQHGRFEAKNSLAFNNGFLQLPIVDMWIDELVFHLNKQGSYKINLPQKFKIEPTFDIDSAYAYIGKGAIRNIGGLLKDTIKLQFSRVIKRVRVLVTGKNDPYNTYNYMLKQIDGFKPIFFFLLGDRDTYDKNVPWTSSVLKELVARLDKQQLCGIHPSYASNEDSSKIKCEKERLEYLIGKPVKCSRQHYLKIRITQTYHDLEAYDITDDYSMGFADQVGFRAGTSLPYTFYCLNRGREINVKIHPFAYMDGTFNDYLNMSCEEAVQVMTQLKRNVQAVNGTFSFIWHNDSLRDTDNWKGWRRLFEKSLEK